MDRLKGIIVPMVTPLDRKRKIDYQGTARLVEHVIKGGVHAIFVLGTTGESQSLSIDDRKWEMRLQEGCRISYALRTLPLKMPAALPSGPGNLAHAP